MTTQTGSARRLPKETVAPKRRMRRLSDAIAATPLAQNLWRILQERKLTDLSALAQLTGLRRTLLHAILTGRSRSSTGDNLQKIADGLGITIGQLLDPHPTVAVAAQLGAIHRYLDRFEYHQNLFLGAYQASAEWFRRGKTVLPEADADAAKMKLAVDFYPVVAAFAEGGAVLDRLDLALVLGRILERYALVHLKDPADLPADPATEPAYQAALRWWVAYRPKTFEPAAIRIDRDQG